MAAMMSTAAMPNIADGSLVATTGSLTISRAADASRVVVMPRPYRAPDGRSGPTPRASPSAAK